MLAGLRKGTEKWQQICKDKRVEMVCPICGKTKLVTPSHARQYTYCSRSCASTARNLKRGSFKQKEPDSYSVIRTEVDEWAKNNKEVIQNTPMNKIKTNLAPVMEIANKHGVHDWRTLTYLVCKDYSRKEFLKYMKQKYMLNQSE